MAQCIIKTPLGDMLAVEVDGALTALDFLPEGARVEASDDTPLLRQVKEQLAAYFAGERKEFDLPIKPRGTDFQQQVWQRLMAIPYGETRSYGQIAREIGRPKASRAVGQANHCNPISIVVPCHRVVGANGRLTGYGGGLPRKEALLELEKTP